MPELDTVAITAKGSTKDASSGDKDTVDPTSENCGIQGDTSAVLDLPSHASEPLSLSSAPDIAAVSPSRLE